MRFVTLHLFLTAFTLGCSVNRPAPDESAARAAEQPAPTQALTYLERVTGNASADARLPMVVAIHGLGDRPDNFQNLFDPMTQQVRLIVPRAPKTHFRGYSWFEIELPMRSSAESMAPGIAAAADRVAVLTETLIKSRPTVGKPIICGFSQGGAISFAAAARRPDLFGGAVPMSGAIPPSLRPKRKTSALPKIRATHGDQDDLIPIEGAEQTISVFQKMGADAELTVFPNVGHTVNQQMRDFLFAQIEAMTSATK